jgi:hypothetical protein
MIGEATQLGDPSNPTVSWPDDQVTACHFRSPEGHNQQNLKSSVPSSTDFLEETANRLFVTRQNPIRINMVIALEKHNLELSRCPTRSFRPTQPRDHVMQIETPAGMVIGTDDFESV